MRYILTSVKEIICAFCLVCIFSSACMAYEGDALDVFEEFAATRSAVSCESFQIKTRKNTPVTDKLRKSADGDVQFVITEPPEKGSVEITDSDGTFVYTPFNGQTGTDTFSFRAETSEEESNIAVCTVSIEQAYESKPSPSSFSYADMIGHWGEYAAVKMVERDIVKGERIGAKYYFYPDRIMTRIDVINILISALGADSISVDDANTHIFEDSAVLPDYINNAAYRAHKLGIIDGRQQNGKVYLNPYECVTRAELMKMIDKAMSSKTKSSVKINFTDMRTVPDWAVQPLKNLVGYGIASGYDDNTIRPFEYVTKAQTVQMLYQMMKYNEQSSVPTAAMRIKNGFYSINIV